MAGGIPKSEFHVLSIDLDICDVVLKDGGDVDLQSAPVSMRIRGGGASVQKRRWIGHTSGKVPLEKTLQQGSVWIQQWAGGPARLT